MVSLGLLVIRLVVGTLFSVHGYAKVFGGKGTANEVSPEAEQVLGEGFTRQMEQGGLPNTAGFLGKLGMPSPKLMAAVLATVELGGGLALILGWKTRPAALALTISQLVAIDKVHVKHGLIDDQGYELNAALTAATAGLTLSGPGRLALD